MAMNAAHYVASNGTDTWANATSSSTPCSLSTAISNAQAADIVYVKSGTYSRSAADTPTADGSVTQPIVWRGCDASWNVLSPSRQSGNLRLDVTNYPSIEYTSGSYNWNASGATAVIYTCMRFTSSHTTSQAFRCGDNSVIYGCEVINSGNNSSAGGISCGSHVSIINSDVACTGASSATAVSCGTGNRVIGCCIYDSASYGIQITSGASNVIIAFNFIYGCTDYGIYKSTTTTSHTITTLNNTIYGKGVGAADAAYLNLDLHIGNHITNANPYAFEYLNSTGSPAVFLVNGTGDLTSGNVSLSGDWDEAGIIGNVTTDNDHLADPANGNLNLLSSATGRAAGFLSYLDTGALQRQEPLLRSGNMAGNMQ